MGVSLSILSFAQMRRRKRSLKDNSNFAPLQQVEDMEKEKEKHKKELRIFRSRSTQHSPIELRKE